MLPLACLGTFILSALLPVAAVPQDAAGATGPFTNARITWYNAGLGACGENNTDSEDVLAMNPVQFEAGKHCKQKISIKLNGITHEGTIMDLCPGCPSGGLDLTPKLFGEFLNTDMGTATGEWSFLGIAPTSSGASSGGTGSQLTTTTTTTTNTGPTTTGVTTTTNTIPAVSSQTTTCPGCESSPTICPGCESSASLPAGVTSS